LTLTLRYTGQCKTALTTTLVSLKSKAMAYTVKQVATVSGVSVRTLHFYDEEGLLKPAYLGANGYRFYEEPQLLILQQILFYREMGFELKQIKEVMRRTDFEIVDALESHRKVIQSKLARTHELIQTIDKTIQHLNGKSKMESQELFGGFTVAAGEDRFNEHVTLDGEPNDCKVSATDTNGAMCVFEFTGAGGWPRHLHYDQDEWIYIVDGEFDFVVGDRRLRLGAGESVFLPRKVGHVWACANDNPGKIINSYQPAGKMEEFFRAVAKPFKDLPTEDQLINKTYTEEQVKSMQVFFEAHGMDLLGPPLGFE
jgi:DNA-binding transcriptional MerR regulator/quercetin dioxygenase-like cupin family protein